MIEPRPFRGMRGIELRPVELSEPSATARFPIGTVIVCPIGHEVAEFGRNIEPNQLVSANDIVGYREGQRPILNGTPDHRPPNPRCHCGRRWTRLQQVKGAGGEAWPQVRTAHGWR